MADQKQPKSTKVGLNRPDSPYSEEECEQIIDKLESLMDGELEPHDQDEVQKLIESCNYCKEQYNLERSIRGIIRKGFQNIKAPSDMMKKIRQTINGPSS